MTTKSFFLFFVCLISMQNRLFCMQTIQSVLPYNNQLALCNARWDQIQAARQELQRNPSALYYAACNNDLKKARLFLAAGADVNAPNNMLPYSTPLHIAVSEGHKELAALLLHYKASVTAKNYLDNTPLHETIIGNHKDLAKLLINHKADVNAQGQFGQTPLYKAVWWERPEMVEFFLEHRANIYIQNHKGSTPLHRAKELHVLKTLLFYRPVEKLYLKYTYSLLEILQVCLEAFPESMHKDIPLIVQKADMTEQEFELEREKQKFEQIQHALSIKDKKGRTVRDKAVENDNQDIVDFIDSVLNGTKLDSSIKDYKSTTMRDRALSRETMIVLMNSVLARWNRT